MVGKSNSNPNVSITSRGAIYVDANELFKSPKVQKVIKEMAEIEKKSQTSQKSSEFNKSAN